MRALIKKFLDEDLSRRDFGKAMMAMGFSAAAIESVLSSVAYAASEPSGDGFEFTGTGGEILAECLKAADVEYIFDVNSTGQVSFYDALAARPELKMIVALQEGQGMSMAQGYELASGKTAVLFVPSIGIPNTMSNLYNAWKDRSAIAVFSDGGTTEDAGRDGFQQVDDWLQPTEQFTKWRWQLKHPNRISEMVRRVIKVAGTPPGGPVYLRIPSNILNAKNVTQTIYPQSKFEIPLQMEPKAELIDEAARLILEAENPMINAGGEITRAGANDDLLELAELLSIPVAQAHSMYGDFPFQHPLFTGFSSMGLPRGIRQTDVFLNLGGQMPDPSIMTAPLPSQTKVINARLEYDVISNVYPNEVAIAAGMKETIRALIDSIKSMATASQIEKTRADRLVKAESNFAAAAERRKKRAQPTWNDSPIHLERFCFEMDKALDDNAIIVSEGGGRTSYNWMDFSKGKKTLIGRTTGHALGWGVGATLGVKIARPDQQVVGIVGDGGLLFGQLESFWTASRYNIPIILIILNNRSYDAERGRIFMNSYVAQNNKDLWKDMSCYLGNPDIDYLSIAKGFDIDGARVTEPDQVKAAIERAAAVTREGRPFIIDAEIARKGPGAESTWHPDVSIG